MQHEGVVQAMQDAERSKSMCVALKQMTHALARMVKGEIGMRVVIWKDEMHRARAQQEQDSVVRNLEAAEKKKNVNIALKQMAQALARMVKGEIGMRLVIWKDEMRRDGVRQHQLVVQAMHVA